MKTDICIRGAGLVGQALALLLARARIRVSLIQAPLAKHRDLRSFALNAASRKVLMDLRVWPEYACNVQHMQVFGDTVGELRFDASDQPLAWIVDASELQERLAAAIGFAPEITLLPFGTEPPAAELTVICEGRSSQTRGAVGASFEQFSYAQSAIAAHLICDEPHQHTAWQWMQTGQVCAFLPRGSSQIGNSVALVWSVPEAQVATLTAMAPDEFVHELGLTTRERLGKLRLDSPLATWPLTVGQASQWCGQASWGAWVLAGDAAHANHPLAGQGLNLGLGDAVELANVLAQKPYFRSFSDMKLLRTYERGRKGDAAALRFATDGLQRVFSNNDSRWLNLRNLGMQGVQAAAPLKAWVVQRASGLR